MIDFVEKPENGWVSLREASAKMGVSPATLRAWADAGRVETYRTPGGHRRFRVGTRGAAPKPAAARMDARWRLLENSALGHLQLARHETDAPGLPAQARMQLEENERALVRVCVQALQTESGNGARVEALGETYGKWMWRFTIPLRETLGAVGLVRCAFVASLVEFAFGLGEPNVDELLEWVSRANQTIDRVCDFMLEYSGEVEKKHVRK